MYMQRRSRNRVTVPVRLVKKLGLKPGDVLYINRGGKGNYVKVDKYSNARFRMPGNLNQYDIFADTYYRCVLVSD